MKSIIAALCLAFAASSFAVAADKKEPSPKQKAQQEKMKACNKQAGEKKLKGEARKKFMVDCLKG
ncbi:MAG: PsiF family protein [Burkholderiales bacterium]